jgi:DNA-binding PadR family transcriptional regulator
MESTKADGCNDTHRHKSTDTETNDADADNNSQQTLACRECDRTNLRAIQGDTGRGEIPKGDGPYACNDCGWHGEPVKRPKRTAGNGRRGLAGKLADPETKLLTDGGVLTGGSREVDPTDLTQFQLDILAILAGDGTPEETNYGLAIKRALEGLYGEEVNHGRLYPNLDDLIEKGLVEKDPLDKRTNQYALTDTGRGVLDARLDWLIDQTATTGKYPAPIAGEGGAAGGVE